MAKLWDGVYQGKGIIKALKPNLKLGENIEVFIPDELVDDYNNNCHNLKIKEVENPNT